VFRIGTSATTSLTTASLTVQTGGTVGGSGSIVGPLITITSGAGAANNGHISPGNSPGILTVTGAATLAANTFLDYDLGTPTSGGGVAGTDNDLLTVSGQLTVGNGITLNVAQGTGFGDGTYQLIHYGTVGPAPDFSTWSISGLPGVTGTFFDTGSGDIEVTVVTPEPASLSLLAVGALGLLRRRGRSRRQTLTPRSP
jgi:fibronectin-binding autotransporter adhesin